MSSLLQRTRGTGLTVGSAPTLAADAAPSLTQTDPPSPPSTRMGLVTYALGIHQRNGWGGRHTGLCPALALLEESRRLGAAGIQVELTAADAAHAQELRRQAERNGMYVEAIIAPPKNADDTARFDHDVQLAQTAGADIARTVILPGRRYEQFKSMDAFLQAEQAALEALQRAAPVLERRRFRLGIENHKDQRVAEKLALLRQVGCEYLGICVDVGNNFPLMEDPLETVRAFAPLAVTVHIKDQAVRPAEPGYLYADAPLGEGFLPLADMVGLLRAANPAIRFNLETITRDPLTVPVLTADYWTTLADTRAPDLARTWGTVRTQSAPAPFITVSRLPIPDQLALEERTIRTSIAYAQDRLRL